MTNCPDDGYITIDAPEPSVEELKDCLRACIQVIAGEFPVNPPVYSDGSRPHHETGIHSGTHPCSDWCKAYHDACRLVGEEP